MIRGTGSLSAGAFLAAWVLAGCGIGSETIPDTKYFVIDYTLKRSKNSPAPLSVSVGVDSFRADAVYRTDKIVFRKVPYRVDFYPYERWGARPNEIVTDRLIDHLQASGNFREVLRASGGTETDYLVRGRVKRFEEVDKPDGQYLALAQIDISVIERKSGKVILRRRLTRSMPAKTKPIQGFVNAMAANLRVLLDQATREVAQAIARHR